MNNDKLESEKDEDWDRTETHMDAGARLSRRKLLASLGAAGVTLAAGELFSGKVIGAAGADNKSNITEAVYNGSSNKVKLPELRETNFVISVTASELRNESNPNADYMYYLRDPGKEGHFYYDPTDTASPDNTGTVLVSVSGARFKRIIESGVVNVQWFGAAGNGISDDGPAIQAALDAIPQGGGTLFIPPTHLFYALESSGLCIENRSNIVVMSTGAMLKFKDGTPDILDRTMTSSNILLRKCKRIRLEGLVLHGNISNRQANAGSESFQSCLSIINSEDVQISHCAFTEGMTDGIYIGGIYSGSSSNGTVALSRHILIDFCTVTLCRRNNISIVAADGVTVSNCRISDAGKIQGTNPKFGIDVEPNKGWFGSCKNITIKHNIVENSEGSYGVSFGGSGHENALVDGNTFIGNKTGLNFNNNAGAPDNKRVLVTNNMFYRNVSGMRMVSKNVDIISGNLFADQSSVGLILYLVDGVQITNNKFINNASSGIHAGNVTDTSIQIKSAFISDNVFRDNVSAATAASSGYAARFYVQGAESMVVFNGNVLSSSPDAPYKMKGVLVDKACIARANNNITQHLYDNTNPLHGFDGVGNFSAGATI